MMSWNIYKAQKPRFNETLSKESLSNDILFLQEDLKIDSTIKYENKEFCSSFYDSGSDAYTGVSIQTKNSLLIDCNCIASDAKEPVLNTPKMILACKTEINGEAIALVNVHGINFVTLIAYQSQMDQLDEVLSHYDGKIILGGDFNTWNWERTKMLMAVVNKHGLTDITPKSKFRKKFMGYNLDYVFTRDFDILKTSVENYQTSSDHNPIKASLK